MIKHLFAVLAAVIFLAGCSTTPTTIAAEKNSDAPLVARALLGDKPCDSDPKKAQKESALLAAAGTWLINKAAEAAVGYVAGAVADAAKNDSETFTITGQNADYLFAVQGDRARMRGCLYVIVAPRVQGGSWCEPGAESNWYSPVSCTTPAPELKAAWSEWSLGKPVFFAEIGMDFPDGGTDAAAIPKAYRVYYPAPISNHPVDKIKGLTITVTATKPGKSSKTTGETVMEVFMGGDGVTPKTVSGKGLLQTSGLWVTIPSAEGRLGKMHAGPVNLSVTVAETQNPTKWLQAIAKFIDTNKQKAIDEIVKNVDPAKREQTAQAEVVDNLKLVAAAAASCLKFSEEMGKLSTAKGVVNQGAGNAEEKLRNGYKLDAACAAQRLLQRETLVAWTASGKTDPDGMCARAKKPDVEINELCAH